MDNLSNIKEKSKELFKKNIQDNMISFLKNIDNDISYKLWLYKFNIELGYTNQFGKPIWGFHLYGFGDDTFNSYY